MTDADRALQTMRINGPVIPSKVAKAIGKDIIMASAILSELSSSNKVRISKLKVGGSPVYYLPGQESRLYDFKVKTFINYHNGELKRGFCEYWIKGNKFNDKFINKNED